MLGPSIKSNFAINSLLCQRTRTAGGVTSLTRWGCAAIFQVQGSCQPHHPRYVLDGLVRPELLDQCLLQRFELIDGHIVDDKIIVGLPR